MEDDFESVLEEIVELYISTGQLNGDESLELKLFSFAQFVTKKRGDSEFIAVSVRRLAIAKRQREEAYRKHNRPRFTT